MHVNAKRDKGYVKSLATACVMHSLFRIFIKYCDITFIVLRQGGENGTNWLLSTYFQTLMIPK